MPIIVEPTTQNGINHSGKVLQGFVVLELDMPTGYHPVDFLFGGLTNCRQEIGMDVATSVYTSTRSKREAKKVKADDLMLFPPIPVLAINDS